jgi:effector-binding domain-containing protein
MKTDNMPRIREIAPISFLYHRAETKISDLMNFVPVARELFKEVARLDLHMSGPVHWHYVGFMGDESNSFTLEVAVPVIELPAGYDGTFHVKRTENFKCVTLLHEGAWNDIPKSYAKLMEFMSKNNLQPLAVTRELYINVDFTNPAANVTEIQMGIAS